MNGPNGIYFPVLVIYENSDVPNVESLEVNGPNPEFIVFSDSSGSGRGSVDSSELQQSGFQKDEVRGRILGTKPLPIIHGAFVVVIREESIRKAMLGSQSANIKGHALVARGPPKKGRGWCDHCKRPEHTKETCWVLHGKPTDMKPQFKDTCIYVVDIDERKSKNTTEASPFNKE
ncbi:hypothetical protein KIW84_052229 [Lathyrus oleraceus]|uniref:Uncharacterized protein n=1 Tax=Pisum sativum TaxID=3888 RepID=A0A9D5ABP3_PEA|nr:hypothetical protein KIW84_052229 [Pisum sativum]